MVTHDLGVARSLGRAIQMRDGVIVADGRAAEVVSKFSESEAHGS
jgi:putative ABC transport system ATP-binding protein